MATGTVTISDTQLSAIIKPIVTDWLTANPPTTKAPTAAQVATAVSAAVAAYFKANPPPAASSVTMDQVNAAIAKAIAAIAPVVIPPVVTPPVVTPPVVIPTGDTFNVGDGPLNASDWVNQVNGPIIANGQFSAPTAFGWVYARWAHPLTTPDQSVTVTAGALLYGVQVTLRDDLVSSNVQMLTDDSGKLSIVSTINGVPTVRAAATTALWPLAAATDQITFAAVGNGYAATKNGAVLLSWPDTGNAFTGTGKYVSIGVKPGAANTGIDSFAATSLGGTVVTPPPASTTGIVGTGLYSWSEIEHLGPAIKDMGAQYHRCGPNGGMDDATFAACLAAGVQTMLTVYPNLPANTDPTSVQVNALLDSQLNRYGPGGTYWKDNPSAPVLPVTAVEILNEPNWYLMGSLQQKANTYAPILISAYAHVKANWPTVKVVGCSIADGSAGASAWIPLLFGQDPKVATSFDVFSFHPYTGSDVPAKYYPPDQTILASWGSWQVWDQIASIRKQLTSYGTPATVPMWITEIGFPISQADGGQATTGATVTLAQQAAYSIRTDVFAARQSIARCFHMYVMDNDGFNGGYFDYATATPRPVAVATKFMLSLIKNAVSMDVVAESYGSGAPFIYRFHNATGTPVIVAWAQTPQSVSIPLAGQTKVSDQLGNPIATASGSSYLAALSETPIWIA